MKKLIKEKQYRVQVLNKVGKPYYSYLSMSNKRDSIADLNLWKRSYPKHRFRLVCAETETRTTEKVVK